MPKTKLTDKDLEILKKNCDENKYDINLNTLKAFASYYYENYPDTIEQKNILSLNKYDMKNKLTNLLCKNYDKLYLLNNSAEKKTSKIELDDIDTLLIQKNCDGEHIDLTELISIASKYLKDDDKIILKIKNKKKLREELEKFLCSLEKKKSPKFQKKTHEIKLEDLKIIQEFCKKDAVINLKDLYFIASKYIKDEDYIRILRTKNKFLIEYTFKTILCYLEKNKSPEIKKKSPEIKKEYFKPPISDNLKSPQIKLKVKAVDKEYLANLKKKINILETNEYNIKKFEEDIKNDDFIKNAVEAHIKGLEYKYKIYEKLSTINWNGAKKEEGKKGFDVNLNEIITNTMTIIQTKIKELKNDSKIIQKKREELYNILYDKDNGIATIQGTSRENIKISLLKNMYMFFKIPHFFFKGFNNFMLTGSAGSGKTKLASVIAHMMNNIGILATNNLIIATKQNLVAEYTGQTAPKTRNLLANALEGVLFIDEAYTLTPCDKNKNDNYADEAVGELINFIDKFIGCIVVIVAGYKDKMNDCFLTFNEGISRRFPKVIDLIPYSSKDMYKIFEIFLNESIEVNKIFKKQQREIMKSYIYSLNENEIFNNQAGDMLNLSKIIGEDAILFDDRYDDEMIKYSFMKFCLTKNVAIDF